MKRLLFRMLSLLLLCSMLLSTVSATNEQISLPFKDVKEIQWYFNDVYYVYTNNLMVGISDTEFGPDETASRAMIATIFWRMEGSPEPSASSTFTDIPENEWYSKSVAWMQEVGLTSGSGNNKFSPNAAITREELATFFYRYAIFTGTMVNPIMGDVSTFADSVNISDWASEAMSWAVGEHIIEGIGNNKLAPENTAIRCEIAAIMHRFLEIDFSQKRLVRIEATGDPEKLIVPQYCASIIFWEHVIVTGYYNDGSTEIIPRQGEVSWATVPGTYNTSKLGPTQLMICVGNCTASLTITVVEALPYTPIDIEAAMEYGNEYAKTLGFEIDYNLSVESAGYGPPLGYDLPYLEKYGGQDVLIEAITEHLDAFKRRDDYLVEQYGENQRTLYVRCYIEYVEEYGGKEYNEYWIYILF